jgi:hypothetical protein
MDTKYFSFGNGKVFIEGAYHSEKISGNQRFRGCVRESYAARSYLPISSLYWRYRFCKSLDSAAVGGIPRQGFCREHNNGFEYPARFPSSSGRGNVSTSALKSFLYPQHIQMHIKGLYSQTNGFLDSNDSTLTGCK